MQLRCPSCSARYQVSAEGWPADTGPHGDLLLRPRKVRCRRCQEVWLATPEDEEEIFDPGPPLEPARTNLGPVPAAFARQSPPEQADKQADGDGPLPPKRRRIWVLVLVPLAFAAAAYVAVASNHVDPQAYGLPPLADWARPNFEAVQLPAMNLPTIRVPEAPATRLALVAEAKSDAIPGGGSVWTIRGTISNTTEARLDVPAIELEILDASGVPLSAWTIRPPADTVSPGRQLAFETTALNPPSGARRVRVSLKPPSLARL